MEKYELIPEQLVYEGTLKPENFFTPIAVSEVQITQVHTQDYWMRLRGLELSPAEIRRTGFPHTHALIDREALITGGTLMCTQYAEQHGIAFNVSGGTHHAFSNRGEGFCMLNDIAIAAANVIHSNPHNRVLVIDLDVHQGNGTAEIFQHEPRVFTFSMHGKDNYPLIKETSDKDIALPTGVQDDVYLQILRNELPKIIDTFQPTHCYYQAGVDVLATDRLGRLGLSRQGCMERDRIVFEYCKRNTIPVVVVMGGGYSHRILDIVEAHCNTYRMAVRVWGC